MIIADLANGSNTDINKYVYAIIKAYEGKYIEAAKVGEMFDMRRMDPWVELPAEYTIKEILTQGIIVAETGKVIIKASVR